MNIFGFSLGASGWAGGAVFFFFSSESAMVAVSDLARGSARGGMADLGLDSFSNARKVVSKLWTRSAVRGRYQYISLIRHD